jgi:hypothetical protein
LGATPPRLCGTGAPPPCSRVGCYLKDVLALMIVIVLVMSVGLER